ncbi:MAG: PAS domain-containing protein, partial [Bacteroidia bacterium]
MNYENWSREELIGEINRLRKEHEKKEELREASKEKIKIDANLSEAWYTDPELVKTIFSIIAEFVYYIEFGENKERIIRFASPNVEHIYGIAREEYLNNLSNMINNVHADDLPEVISASQAVFREKKPQALTYRFFHEQKKKYVWLEETVYPKTDDDGKIIANLGVIRDVTKRIEAEIGLRQSRESLEKVLHAINQVVYHINFEQLNKPKVIYLSSNIDDLLGIDYDTYLNDPLSFGRYCHPDDLGAVLKVLEEQRKDQQPKTYRYRFMNVKRNEYIWLEEYVVKTYSPEGQILTAFGITRDITKQKEDEDRLRTSEERFRMLAENADDIIFRLAIHPTPHYEYISPSIEKITGYAPDVFYSNPNFGQDLVHPEDRNRFKTHEQGAAELSSKSEAKEVSFVTRWICKDGRVIWIETRNKLINDERGKPIAVEGISRDITRSKIAEEELLASREYYRSLIDQSPDGILILDLEGNLLTANPAAMQIMKAKGEEDFKSKNIFAYIHPEDLPRVSARMKAVVNGEEIPFETLRTLNVLGEEVEIESRSLLYQYQGSPAIIAFVRDISVFRKLEKEQLRVQLIEESNQQLQNEIQDRIRAERQLSETQKSLRLLIDSSIDTISSADRDGHITEFNAAAERTFGYTREEALGEHLTILFGDDKTQAEEVRAKLEADGYYSGEVLNRRKNGELFTSLLAASLLRNEDGEVIGSMGVSRDITERKKFERQLIETQKNLRLIIDSSLDMIIAADKDGRVTEFNASAERTFGYTREEALGMGLTKIYASKEQAEQIAVSLLGSGNFFAGEVINLRKNGEKFTSFLSASLLRNEEGEIIGSMGISRDISDRLKAERELQLREEKYRAVFNQAYTGIALVSVQGGNYMEVNERLCKMLGYRRDEMLAMSVHDLQVPGDLSRLPKGEDFIKLGFRHIVDEHRYRHQNGETVFVNITITLVRGDDDKPLYFVYVYEDLTPKRKAEEQLRIQAAKLNAIIESSSHIIWTIDRENKLTSFNKNQAEWFKRSYGEISHIGLNMLEYSKRASVEYAGFWQEKIEKTFAGESQHFELPFTMKDGKVAWREIYLNPINGDSDEVIE